MSQDTKELETFWILLSLILALISVYTFVIPSRVTTFIILIVEPDKSSTEEDTEVSKGSPNISIIFPFFVS